MPAAAAAWASADRNRWVERVGIPGYTDPSHLRRKAWPGLPLTLSEMMSVRRCKRHAAMAAIQRGPAAPIGAEVGGTRGTAQRRKFVQLKVRPFETVGGNIVTGA